jgi:hypothetical protein
MRQEPGIDGECHTEMALGFFDRVFAIKPSTTRNALKLWLMANLHPWQHESCLLVNEYWICEPQRVSPARPISRGAGVAASLRRTSREPHVVLCENRQKKRL